ncbi:MAG: SusC/RagA family TonB-linked outer membrane protein [Gemmatimonadaceae bacterium]
MKSVTRLWIAAVLLAVIPSLGRAQQTRRVTGHVTVQGGTEPIPGVTVQIVGTTLGATGDEAGNFSVSVPAGAQQLRVRRIGYTAKIVPVGANETTVTVSLNRDVLQLETQVITGQATTVARANVANAVTVVNTEQLNKVPQQTIENALQGKVPGAVITSNSGAPGGGIQLRLRGTNTINGNYQPLYVVDGVVVDNSAFGNGLNSITGAGGAISSNQDQQVNRIADLNPQDIETIEVLKGPSAGAIYGSRGANGVVIITTKKGRAGTPTLNVVQRFGTTAVSNTLKLRCFTQAQATDYVNANTPGGFTGATDYFAANPYAGCTDAQNQLYGNKGLSYETSASLRGGTADGNTTYFTSAGVKHDAGITSTDGYDKQNLRINLAQQFGSRINVSANTEVLHTLTKRGISGNDNNAINPLDVISGTPSFYDFSRKVGGVYTINPWAVSGANVLQNQQAIQTPEDVFRMIGSSQARWSAVASSRQTLDFSLLGGVDSYSDQALVYSPSFTYLEQSGVISPYPGTVARGNTNVTNANLNLNATHKLITSPFTATTSLGLRQSRSQVNNVFNQGLGMFPGVTNVATAIQTAVNQAQSLTKSFSYFAQEELLTADERVLLTGAINAERSSTNGDAHAFYAYPKASISYKLPWLPPATDNLKLRLAYGKAGNTVPVNFKYTFLTPLLESGVNGLRQGAQIGLSNVKPEQTTEVEGGFDASFFGGRAGLEVTQYEKKTTGMVLTSGLAPSTGFTTKVINGGTMRNVGTEVGLNLVPIQTGMFTWTSNTTFSANRNKVLSLPVPAFATGSGFSERFGSYKIQSGYSATQVVVFSGFDSTFDANGKYLRRARHELHIGDQNPDFQMGFSNNFTLGKLSVSSLLDWRKGGYAINLTNNYFDFNLAGSSFADTTKAQARGNAFLAGQPVYAEHASFAKLRELTVSYDLGQSFAQHFLGSHAKDLRIEASGHNLFTWTNYTGYDPEVSNFGNAPIGRTQDVTPYPPSRQFFLSLNATF